LSAGIESTAERESEFAYKKICEFEKNYCEDFNETAKGFIVYEINTTRLAELENETDLDLFSLTKDLDSSTVEFPSYKKLFEAKYKNRFLKNMAAIKLNELQRKLGPGILEEITKADKKINNLFTKIKEADLDNDNVSDRIDIDDTKNSVQTVADLDIVKNSTNKETNDDKKKKKKEKQKDNNLEQ